MAQFQIPAELLARCAGQSAICKTVLERYIEQMSGDVPQLREYVQSGQTDRASKLAHRIKGASANVVAEELRSLASQLEVEAAASNSQTETLLAELEQAWARYHELTTDYLAA